MLATKFTALFAVLLFSVMDLVFASDCLVGGEGFAIAGASTVARLASAWIGASSCDTIVLEAGGSTSGAARVCGTKETAVDIGGMSRPFNLGEASTEDQWNFNCERSLRSVIQVEVAYEGISAAVNIDGIAAECVFGIGGLSIDQLRWMFSNLLEGELLATGWDPRSVPNSDNDPSTHLWSELDSNCPDTEILIGVLDEELLSGSYAFFSDIIFRDNEETFDIGRPGAFFNATDESDLVEFIWENDAAISFFGLAYILGELDQESVSLVPVIEDEEVIKPSAISFEGNSYPLARRLFMNVYRESVEKVSAFFEFGFSSEGDKLLKSTGLWPIDEWKKTLMKTRLQTPQGIPMEEIEEACGPTDGFIAIAGSSTVFPVAQVWSEIYQVGCDTKISVQGGGSSNGAGRVCGNLNRGSPVDIGGMSREWKTKEAKRDGFLYSCLEPGDPSRSAIQIDVAIDGLTVAVQEGGAAWRCIQVLGGLTIDQLRWIYSSYNDLKLEELGWDPTSLKNSDRNSQTHLLSELDPRCERIEIRIAGADDQSGTYEYFLETILADHDNGETFDTARPGFGYENSDNDEALVAYLQEFGEAISYFGYSYYYANQDALAAIPIQNDSGAYILPTQETIGGGQYTPLARRIFMNVLNNESSLKDTVPFLKFGLSRPDLVDVTGYVPLPEPDIQIMFSRLDKAQNSEILLEDDRLSTGAIVGLAMGSFCGLLCLVWTGYFCMNMRQKK